MTSSSKTAEHTAFDLAKAVYKKVCLAAVPLTAARIARVSDHLVQVATEMQEEAAKNGKPLFIIAGENHFLPESRLVALEVALTLQRQGYKVVFGTEVDYTLMNQRRAAATELENVIDDADYKAWLEKIRDNDEYDDSPCLKLARARIPIPFTPHTYSYLEDTLFDQSIRIAYNDAAMYCQGSDAFLDMEDPYIQEVCAEEDNVLPEMMVKAQLPTGMYLRNRVMMARALEHVEAEKPDIYIQLCGNAHVAGAVWKSGDKKPNQYHKSLMALFKKSNEHVMGIVSHNIWYRRVWDVPAEADRMGLHVTKRESVLFAPDLNDVEKSWLDKIKPHLERGRNRPV